MKIFDQDLQNSSKFYSKVLLRPLFGKKREILLNRTGYSIYSTHEGDFMQDSINLYFPEFKGTEYELDLKWYEQGKSKYFLLNSKSNQPFRINGNLVFSAIISHGDKVDIGHNRLEFEYEHILIQEDLEISNRIIESNLNILIEGETGTGKSFLAKKIHERSGRKGRFVHINLSSFSRNLLESELFGHVKGAFTGAINDKMGAFKEADCGTLFLDEVDSLPIDIQTKLLLFLDSKSYRSVGDFKEHKVDVRLVFASGKNLLNLVTENIFRKDMYFRLSSGVLMKLRPLRHDKKKLLTMLRQFELSQDCVLSIRLEKFYCNLTWPGNIRQLYGHLQKKLVMTNGRKLDLDSLDEELLEVGIPAIEDQSTTFVTYKDLKVSYFSNVLSRMNGDVRLAANKLDVSINTVKNVLQKAG
ncbi:hypothetical protein A9Q84_04650 [Halobacteriovorax marinus]|uniref:Sigma-54 factor interaction domain-containing protein n=1 Tax=Halobacteriovorax marinus TaxID=97084 RepID=A0A1Y5FB31_9BACT|nr:hypothetical protein A9Q84_04650 [Halobacteriovorax marinus]